MATDEIDQNPKLDQQQVSDYTHLTKSIFPGELEIPATDIEAGEEAIGNPAATDIASSSNKNDRAEPGSTDFEHEIIALAHQIIRRHDLVLPSGQTISQSTSSTTVPARYPPIPLDRKTEHTIIWRTTESAAEALNPLQQKARKAVSHRPTTYDNDLEPVLPPGLTREVVGWTNRLLLNMATTRPGIVKNSSHTAPHTQPLEEGSLEKATSTAVWEWTDVLAALMVDGQTSADREYVVTDADGCVFVRLGRMLIAVRRYDRLNHRITARIKARFETSNDRDQDVAGSAEQGSRNNERIGV
jgi:hypothetical protein